MLIWALICDIIGHNYKKQKETLSGSKVSHVCSRCGKKDNVTIPDSMSKK